jgi:hypothetical protein
MRNDIGIYNFSFVDSVAVPGAYVAARSMMEAINIWQAVNAQMEMTDDRELGKLEDPNLTWSIVPVAFCNHGGEPTIWEEEMEFTEDLEHSDDFYLNFNYKDGKIWLNPSQV